MMYEVADLIAHEAPMILIDRVVSSSDEHIETAVEIRNETPFLYGGRVPAYVVVEYMAQSIAAFSGIQARARGEEVSIGFLLGTRKLELMCDGFFVGDEILIEASPLYNDGEMASFDCLARSGEKIVAKARLNVYQPAGDTLNTESEG